MLQKCDLLQNDRRGRERLESSNHTIKQTETERKLMDSKPVSWEWTGIIVSTIKEPNNYMVKLEYLGHIGQACAKIQQPVQHLLLYIQYFNTDKVKFLNYTPHIGSACWVKY